MIRLRLRGLFLGAALSLSGAASAQDGWISVREDFTVDPGWEGVHNRVVATSAPTVRQDFGYRAGTIASSTTPASYGMPVGPFSFADRLSASGRLRLRRAPARSGAYLGFFNSTRQGWRP